MNEKTLEQLDYKRIREQASALCVSEEGRSYFVSVTPFTRKEDMCTAQALALCWTQVIQSHKKDVLQSWQPVKHLFSPLRVPGAVLETSQLYALGMFCRSVNNIKKTYTDADMLGEYAKRLPDLLCAQNLIFNVIDTSGEIKDLPQIKEIRNSIAAIRKDIERVIKDYTVDSRFKDVLQSELPVLRSGRQVLAVKAERKTKIRGIVHEVSQTAHTVYIEPEEAVRKNNELVQEEFRLAQEIRRIIGALCASLVEFVKDFENALPLMLELDSAYACALWGVENKCIFAEDAENRPLALVQARHPLLGTHAVPIDVEFSQGARVLIVTGPNTGGKTVTLKTIALFLLLHQSGMPVNALQGTRLPFFTSVLADIGDEQNIDKSLSTFGARMKNIGEMLTKADKNTLLLLDELGSGTEAQEGAAVAMAVLDAFIQKGAFVLVSTHHGSLKNYGYTHRECVNASLEFCEHSLQPTYRVLMGIPGESHALDIAQKNGLPQRVVDKARLYMANGSADIAALIRGLNEKHAECETLYAQYVQKEKELYEKEKNFDKKKADLIQKEAELREKSAKEGSVFLAESRKKLENLVRILREGEINREKTLKVKAFIKELEQTIENEKQTAHHLKTESAQKSIRHKNTAHSDEATELHIGDYVYSTGLNIRGVIVAKAKKGEYLVQTGSVKIACKQKDLRVQQERAHGIGSIVGIQGQAAVRDITPAAARAFSNASFTHEAADTSRAVFELRLLGMHLEEALKALEKQLDLCVVQGLHEFSVIHGKGNGVLQQGVHECLKNYPANIEFAFAPPEDGGTGKTYVRFI